MIDADWQSLAALGVVGLAALWLVRRWWQRRRCGDAGGCHGCGVATIRRTAPRSDPSSPREN